MRNKLIQLLSGYNFPDLAEPSTNTALIAIKSRFIPCNIVIYGAGAAGYSMLNKLKVLNIKPICFVDKDSSKDGTLFIDIPVIHTDKLPELIQKTDTKILAIIAVIQAATSKTEQEMITKLLYNKGCYDVHMFSFYQHDINNCFSYITRAYYFIKHKKQFIDVYDQLEDDCSRIVLFEYIKLFIHDDVYRGPLLPTIEKYFGEGIFNWSENEHFVDCGASIGDTIFYLLNKVKRFSKIYSFDTDITQLKSTIALLPENIREKIEAYEVQLSDKEYESLDTILKDKKVTLIKMDVEGAELAILHGAINIIKEQEPVLALCAYHKNSDLTDFIEFIKSISPNYKFYLRKYPGINTQGSYGELVLYAVPKHRALKTTQ